MKTHLTGVLMGTLIAPVAVSAATIQYTAETVDDLGTGFGNILTLLVLQAPGGNGTQSGSVLWNGSDTVLTGDAQIQGPTRSVAELTAVGITPGNIGMIFNINEPGGAQSSVFLQDFELVFQDAAGNELFTAPFDAPDGGLELQQVGSGQGAAGYLFVVSDFSLSEMAFFDDPTNRLGQRTTQSILEVAGGAENFYVAAVPEPTSAMLLGLLAPAFLRRRRAR